MTRQTPPQQPGERERSPAAAASHFNELNENMNDDDEYFFLNRNIVNKEDTRKNNTPKGIKGRVFSHIFC
jgi:hypothetical protein